MTATLLVEIGLEELPPKAMRPLAEAFGQGVANELTDAGIAYSDIAIHASPRRLAVSLADAGDRSADLAVEKFGPAIAIAFDEAGRPTRAGEGFARSVGAMMADLATEDSDKGPRLVYRGTAAGQPLEQLLQPAIDNALKRLPIPKRMRWGSRQQAFVRPVHWVVALHGHNIVPVHVFGHDAGRETRGHRFHCGETIVLAHADDYVARLKDPGHVLVNLEERRTRIQDEVAKAAERLSGRALITDDLVEEVLALVEWPSGIAGHFEKRFLELPREVLIATLEGHQRYFPVVDATNQLKAGFVTVANLASRDPAQVVAGNERVVRPRLSDALFFWEQDKRHGLASYIDQLSRVSFQRSLGSLADKSERISGIGVALATVTGAKSDDVKRAAKLAKTDLLTEMVGEFPELQGLMGRYYALDAGETPAVAEALAEQYAPEAAGAPIPVTKTGQTIALADRLDTLAGIFSIGKRPSGDKDPFALRRAALGVLRILIEADLPIDLAEALHCAIDLQPVDPANDTFDALWMFHVERLRGYYQERGVPHANFEAVLASSVTVMTDFDARIAAIGRFTALDEAQLVCGSHKRIRNILRRNVDEAAVTTLAEDRLVEPEEQTLASVFSRQSDVVNRAMLSSDYSAALAALAAFAQPLDAFFERVMVMSEDPQLKNNRLALLSGIDHLCRRVADISCLSPE
ncbi:MAG: glycine--tRNA ligase subunit beta [Salinisphaera sp.]|jgi:glycyl-tRNA synthetase beta chain|nr:glycine--tRNA ligase subunit beta [Salinisphaera sp.]